MTDLPRLPGRRVWNPDAVDDGSRTMVNPGTGEIVEIPASETRARRLRQRAARHEAALAEQRARQAERNRTGIDAARAALPARPTPPGLERRPDPVGAYLTHTAQTTKAR